MTRTVAMLSREELEALADVPHAAVESGDGVGLVDAAGALLEAGVRVGAVVRHPLAHVEVVVVTMEGVRTVDAWIGDGITVAHPRADRGHQPVWLAPAHAAATMVAAMAGLTDESTGPGARVVVRRPPAGGNVVGGDLRRWVAITITTGGSKDRMAFGVHASTGGLLRMRLAEDGSAIGDPVDVLDLWAGLAPLAGLADAVTAAVRPELEQDTQVTTQRGSMTT